jgi:hypothetical protein
MYGEEMTGKQKAGVQRGGGLFHLIGRHRIMGAVSDETTLVMTVLKVVFFFLTTFGVVPPHVR